MFAAVQQVAVRRREECVASPARINVEPSVNDGKDVKRNTNK